VVIDMTGLPMAQANTGLSPEWDRWFDEAFTDLISHDEDLVRTEFDALINASWQQPPPPSPPAPSATPPDPQPERRHDHRTGRQDHATEHNPAPTGGEPRSPP
jgi:hypothetical protein